MLGHDAGPVVELPGGLVTDNRIERRVMFHSFTGRMEMDLMAYAAGGINPVYVSEILFSAIAAIGDQPPGFEDIERLSVGDRQFLMLCLAILLGEDQIWLRPQCEVCHAPFDVGFARSQLPVQKAGAGYPQVDVPVSLGTARVRVPNGEDQARLTDLTGEEAVYGLLQSCLLALNDEQPGKDTIEQFDAVDIAAIEAALEAIAPEVATSIDTQCPECGTKKNLQLEPYDIPDLGGSELYEDIHKLACHYSWNEETILSLPRERRRIYLSLLARDKGVHA